MADQSFPIFEIDNLRDIISAVSYIFLVVPALAGAGRGLKDSAPGISSAAEIKIEFTSVMAALCFLTTPVIYMLIIFFVFKNKEIATFKDALVKLSCCVITGWGCYFTAYTIGSMAKHVLVTKVKEKKFSGQFYLVFVFVEFVGLFALIVSLIFLGEIKEGGGK
ncbi:hypothetical protein VCUG_00460 [Vavraia culicis subsp. floridensis]|uniref:V-ATPase proteolipid subunit C-like domain-containing protein n=1 Tax=Vavraia culicis (isolate floridensis) TaxID=948595 RepID=L2GXF6_VAVCU|nr:uncharacterized protein VCUG_00460 [Vavraia culicis subsp. floridensis]ELA48037.1 hypothetical protein VCUG_00460 [Vavraia culicis subsp. floridensis]